jgi:hypothetical protein
MIIPPLRTPPSFREVLKKLEIITWDANSVSSSWIYYSGFFIMFQEA